MNWQDFLIGFLLMNAMPHLVLGTWGGRMFSAFGFGNRRNIAYGFVQAIASAILFTFRYGWEGWTDNGIYSGAWLILLIYFLTGSFWQRRFAGSQDIFLRRERTAHP